MEQGGAFPRWLNRLWWMLLPGVLLVILWALGMGPYFVRAILGDKATGLAAEDGLHAVAGDIAVSAVVILVSWLLASLALMHLWFVVAAIFAVRRRAQLQRQERWKLVGAGFGLLAVYSPLIAVLVVRMFAGFGEG